MISGKGDAPNLDQCTALIENFAGIELDSAAQAEILAVLKDCAARRRAVEGTPEDPNEHFLPVEQEEKMTLIYDPGFKHPRKELRRPPPAGDGPLVQADEFLEPSPRLLIQSEDQYRSSDSEMSWQMLDDEEGMKAVEEAVESVKRSRLPSPLAGEGQGEGAAND